MSEERVDESEVEYVGDAEERVFGEGKEIVEVVFKTPMATEPQRPPLIFEPAFNYRMSWSDERTANVRLLRLRPGQ